MAKVYISLKKTKKTKNVNGLSLAMRGEKKKLVRLDKIKASHHVSKKHINMDAEGLKVGERYVSKE